MQNEVGNRMFIMAFLVFALSRSYAILGNLRDRATGGGEKIWGHYFIWQLSLVWRMSASRTKEKKNSRRRHEQLRLVVYLWLVEENIIINGLERFWSQCTWAFGSPFVPSRLMSKSWEPCHFHKVPACHRLRLLRCTGSNKKEPSMACLSVVRASHSHKTWAEISSCAPHL